MILYTKVLHYFPVAIILASAVPQHLARSPSWAPSTGDIKKVEIDMTNRGDQ